MKSDDLRKNASGCSDPTAYQAITNVDNEQKRFDELVNVILHICRLTGFEVHGELTFKNRKTGRVWKHKKK